MKQLLILTLLCLLTAPVWAADGVSFDPSQNIYAGRQLGMGGLSVAFSDDAAGIFANPANLTNLEFPQLIGASKKLVMDQSQYLLFCWAIPTDAGTFGFGYSSLNTGGSFSTKLDPASGRIMIDPSREAMSYDNHVIALSFAKDFALFHLPRPVALGATFKFFGQTLSGDVASSASGTGIDLSTSYQALSWLKLGANLQNMMEANLAWEGGAGDKIGGYYKLGCKMNLLGTQEALFQHDQKLYGGIDVAMPHTTLSSSTNYSLGLEYFPTGVNFLPQDKVALRAGFNMDQNGSGLAFGVGLINSGFRFDYAFYQKPGMPGDIPHYFSLSYIGDRIPFVFKEIKAKESNIVFYEPKDRSITDKNFTKIKALVKAKQIIDQKTVWKVTGISQTSEVKEVAELEDLSPIYFNGKKINQIGTVETSANLVMGRNVFQFFGDTTSPEVFRASGEARVLRFNPFSDTPMDYWAIRPIALSVTLGLVTGYPDGTFQPAKGISRAELVTLLVRSMPVRLAETVDYSGFSDVSSTHWAAQYIAYGTYKNLITGYPDGTFKPSKVLTRAEGVTILTRYAQLPLKDIYLAPFKDLEKDHWAKDYIHAALEAGMLEYIVGKDFNPNAPFPRAEACEVLYLSPPIKARVDLFWNTGETELPKALFAPEIPENIPVTP